MAYKDVILLNHHKSPYYQSYLWIHNNFYQNPNGTFFRSRKKNSKINMESQKTAVAKTVLERNKTRGLILPDFSIYCKATVTKVQYMQTDRHTD